MPIDVAHQVGRNQEPRDDEEDIHTDVSATGHPRPEVIDEHQQYGNRSESLDLLPNFLSLRRAGWSQSQRFNNRKLWLRYSHPLPPRVSPR